MSQPWRLPPRRPARKRRRTCSGGSAIRVDDVDDGNVDGAVPTAAGSEELRLDLSKSGRRWDDYGVSLVSLPCAATLRVMDLVFCDLRVSSKPFVGLAFPCLTDLRLRVCVLSEGYLQAVVDAAPRLAGVQLVNVCHEPVEHPCRRAFYLSDGVRLCLRLRSPTVTDFALDTTIDCAINVGNERELAPGEKSGIDLDMPSLRSFRYKGYAVRLSLHSPAPHLTAVDLDVGDQAHYATHAQYEPLTRLMASFCYARVLKLRVHSVENIVAGNEGIPPPMFPNLDVLELDGGYEHEKDTAAAMATLLRCCPAISELQLRLNKLYDHRGRRKDPKTDLNGGSISDFRNSLERFKRFKSYMGSLQGSIEDELGEISELTALSSCKFSCLETSLRKVALQFKDTELDCFEVQLAKFLVENTMNLEEMHVNNGARLFWDHLNHKLAKWRADSFRRRNLPSMGLFQVHHSVLDSTDASSSSSEGRY